MSRTYIWYGRDKFDLGKIEPISALDTDRGFFKPRKGGLWASPVNSEMSWKKWCDDEEFETIYEHRFDYKQKFKLKEKAKRLYLKDSKSLLKFIDQYTKPILYSPETLVKSKIKHLFKNYERQPTTWHDFEFKLTSLCSCLSLNIPKLVKDYDALEIHLAIIIAY